MQEVNDVVLFHLRTKVKAEFNVKNRNGGKAPSQFLTMDCIREQVYIQTFRLYAVYIKFKTPSR